MKSTSQAEKTGVLLGVASWTWQPEQEILQWSDAVWTLLGVDPAGAPDWSLWLSRVHPEDREMAARSFDAAALPEGGERLSYRLVRMDGSVLWLEDRRSKSGAVCSGLFIDLTETARSAAKSWETQRRADRIMEAAGFGIMFRDFESGEDFWNDTLFRLFGLTPEARPPSFDLNLPNIHPEDKDRVSGYVEERRSLGGDVDCEYRVVLPGGELRWVREHGQYLRSGTGRPLRYYGAVRDITVEKRHALELSASRHRLKLALEANNMAVWELNRDTRQSHWSDEYYTLLGYEPQSVPSDFNSWLAAVHPEDRDWVSSLMSDAMKVGDIAELTYRVLANGRERWVRDSWSWAYGSGGELVCHGLTADITAAKLRENRLVAAEKSLRLAVEAGGMGLWEQNLETGVYVWNDQMYYLLGYRPGEVVPSVSSWNARVHPEDLEKVRATIQGALRRERDFTLEYRLQLPGNVEHWVEERARITFQGGVARHHGVMFDITERKALEISLRDSRERLQLALDTGEVGYWSGPAENEAWDERMYRILGFEPFSVPPTAQNWADLVHPEDREYFEALDDRGRETGEPLAAEYRIIRPDGALRWVEGRFQDRRDPVLGRHGVLRDITDRKSREEYFLHSQRLEAAGQLLSGVVHDFNNLLAVIAAILERVEHEASDPDTARRLRHAREAAMAGALFNRRLINISRVRKRAPEPLWIEERMLPIMGAMKSVMKPGIRVWTDLQQGLWPVLVDPLDLESAIINLIINARDAISGEGSIVVAAHNVTHRSEGQQAGDYVVLSVRDTGCGMEKSTLARALEPFFSTKPEGAGTGLGLSSVAAFASATRGFMEIESAPGEGTAVSIFIPRAAAARAPSVQAAEDVPMGDGELVLVVDDDAAVREGTLQRVEALGYSVEEAVSAQDAIGKLPSLRHVALVLSDVAMPGTLNGFGLRDWMASNMPHIPVLLFSAHEHIVRKLEGASSMPGDVLPKTCTREQLARALRCALQGTAADF